jgi:peptidoglycan/LPS O-acetylase OafA/YrhL
VRIATQTLATRQHLLGRDNGFGLLRLTLATGIVAFHSVTLTQGSANTLPPLLQAAGRLILPAFFALSGFLVAASFGRAASVREFLLLRVLRLLPALSLVVAASALLLGPLVTSLAPADYFRDPLLPHYFLNLWGAPQFSLPRVFAANPRSGVVNGALWTIPLEMACYVLLALCLILVRPRFRLPAAALAAAFLLMPWWSLPWQDLFAAFAMGVLLQVAAPWLPHHRGAGLCGLAAALGLSLACPYLALGALPLSYGMVWLGLQRLPAWRADYSYGLYLTAYPLQQVLVQLMPGQTWQASLAAGWLLALGCAVLLWHHVERPVLDRRHEVIARLEGRLARADAG